MPHVYPRLRIGGAPRERGRQYGRIARDQIHRSRGIYQAAFRSSVGWRWEQAVDAARRFVPVLEATHPSVLEELLGIAEGAELPHTDVMAMNARTEILWSATVRRAESQRMGMARECSSFGLAAQRTAVGRPWVGQNWDWLDVSRETVVVLEVEPDEEPAFVTIVEAGLLAKTSLNAAGLAVATNALVTTEDRGDPGVPYHVLLRVLAGCRTVADALAAIQANVRASSGNYLLGHADGVLVNVEAGPGDFRAVQTQLPMNGALWHTNHFVGDPPVGDEVSIYAMPDTLGRYQHIERCIASSPEPATIASLRTALSDHAQYPDSVCCHPDERTPEPERWSTVMSVVMDPAAQQLWLACGTPCSNSFHLLDLTERFLGSRPPS